MIYTQHVAGGELSHRKAAYLQWLPSPAACISGCFLPLAPKNWSGDYPGQILLPSSFHGGDLPGTGMSPPRLSTPGSDGVAGQERPTGRISCRWLQMTSWVKIRDF